MHHLHQKAPESVNRASRWGRRDLPDRFSDYTNSCSAIERSRWPFAIFALGTIVALYRNRRRVPFFVPFRRVSGWKRENLVREVTPRCSLCTTDLRGGNVTAEDDRRGRGTRRTVLGRDSGSPAVQEERFLQDMGERAWWMVISLVVGAIGAWVTVWPRFVVSFVVVNGERREVWSIDSIEWWGVCFLGKFSCRCCDSNGKERS